MPQVLLKLKNNDEVFQLIEKTEIVSNICVILKRFNFNSREDTIENVFLKARTKIYSNRRN